MDPMMMQGGAPPPPGPGGPPPAMGPEGMSPEMMDPSMMQTPSTDPMAIVQQFAQLAQADIEKLVATQQAEGMELQKQQRAALMQALAIVQQTIGMDAQMPVGPGGAGVPGSEYADVGPSMSPAEAEAMAMAATPMADEEYGEPVAGPDELPVNFG